MAKVLRSSVRDTDAVSRQGGDEFAVLLAGTPLPEVEQFFGRFREEVMEYSECELGFRLSLSAGAACFPSDAADPNAVLEATDTDMYRAKRQGKNQLYHRSINSTPLKGEELKEK